MKLANAKVEHDGDRWVLVLVRDLPHPPEAVWQALTDPTELREWATPPERTAGKNSHFGM